MKDYDAIARGAQKDDTWSIFSVRYDKYGKPWRFEITGGINGEGPAYTVGVIEGKERADEICEAHNAAILRKHDEAEASGERRVRCNHCMSVYDEEYIEVDAGGPDTGETCPCCGKGDALMDMSRPAPRDEKTLGELYNWIETKHGDLPASKLSMQDRQEITSILAREAPKAESKEGAK